MRYRIWYMKPEVTRDFIFGTAFLEKAGIAVPTVATLGKTHVLLTEAEGTKPDDVFIRMQAEEWSPRGEARELIEKRGLAHTSMSVGDVMIDEAGKALMVDVIGYRELAA